MTITKKLIAVVAAVMLVAVVALVGCGPKALEEKDVLGTYSIESATVEGEPMDEMSLGLMTAFGFKAVFAEEGVFALGALGAEELGTWEIKDNKIEYTISNETNACEYNEGKIIIKSGNNELSMKKISDDTTIESLSKAVEEVTGEIEKAVESAEK